MWSEAKNRTKTNEHETYEKYTSRARATQEELERGQAMLPTELGLYRHSYLAVWVIIGNCFDFMPVHLLGFHLNYPEAGG